VYLHEGAQEAEEAMSHSDIGWAFFGMFMLGILASIAFSSFVEWAENRKERKRKARERLELLEHRVWSLENKGKF
jgi:hypothetical protein